MAFRKKVKVNCVSMVQQIRRIPLATVKQLTGLASTEDNERYLRSWVQWVLSHDISFWWENWQEAHEDYEDYLTQLQEQEDIAAVVEEEFSESA